MINLPEDRRPPLTPQLALRVAIIGSLALLMFAIVFFRLWYLQVLSGDKYVAQAQTNRVRQIAIPAPRGQIVDRSGNVLVDSVPTIAVQVTPTDLPKDPARLDAAATGAWRSCSAPRRAPRRVRFPVTASSSSPTSPARSPSSRRSCPTPT